jgi:hypothetical protein
MTRSHHLLLLGPVALALAVLGCGGTATTAVTADTGLPEPPKLQVGNTRLNAGEVDYARPRDFPFTITNAGGMPLELTLTHKSCSCASVDVPAPIPPGGQDKVVIHWAPIPGNTGAYTVSADLSTNDPNARTLKLAIDALIHPTVRVLIEGRENSSFVDFGDEPVPPGQKRERELQVFSTKLDKFDLDASTALPGFEIEKTPLAAGAPVDGARSGYKLVLRTTDKLPIGYVRTDLNLALRNLGGEPDRTLSIPVYAVIGSGIFSVSRPGLFLFQKPNITDEDTQRVDLTIISKAPDEKVEVASYEPKFLKVDPPQQLPGGRWRITAHLGNPDAAKFQPDAPVEGQVVLKVSGLDRPVPIRVKWSPLPK